MSRINKSLYLGWIIGGAVVGLLLFGASITGIVILAMRFNIADMIVWLIVCILVLFLGIALLVVNVIYSCLLLYKAWQAIQGGQTRTTPEKAVGFIFIPVYNFYWYFIAYWTFARDYNLYIRQKSLDLPRLPEKLFLSYPILLLCGLIPFAGYIAVIAALVILFIISNKTIDAVNSLHDLDITVMNKLNIQE
jgi:hypothetical protein